MEITRNDVLGRNLHQVQIQPGTQGCIVTSGILDDPYTGQQIRFTREDPSRVHVDHVYPLAMAWDMGAWAWQERRRVDFANDQEVNTLVVDGSANASKGDRGPGEWMPVNGGYRCTYLRQYLQVAVTYELPILQSDVEAVAAAGCWDGPAPPVGDR